MAADYSAAKDSPLFARRKDAADNWSFPPSVMNIVVPKDVLPGFQFPESTFFIVPPNSDDHSIADGPDHPQFGRVSGLLSQEDAYCGSAGRGLRSARRPPPDLCKLDAGDYRGDGPDGALPPDSAIGKRVKRWNSRIFRESYRGRGCLCCAYRAAVNAARSILGHQRAAEADRDYCMSINEILALIPDSL